METLPYLILSSWSAGTKLYPSHFNKLPGIAESRYVSGKHIKLFL